MLFDPSGMSRLAALIVGTSSPRAFAAWAAAATVGPASSGGLEAGSATLPPLPADIKARGRLNVAVKCDSPPFGSKVGGKHVGFDVDIARELALFAFGKKNRVSFTCVTTPEREAALTSGSADLVIATFSYTPDRDTRIDFSRAYYKATGRLLVTRGSRVQSLADLPGARVATTTRVDLRPVAREVLPDCEARHYAEVHERGQQWRTKKADALMWDDPALVNIASRDRSAVILKDTFLPSPYGIGIKQGNAELKRWVDARLEFMRRRDAFAGILNRHFPLHLYGTFLKNVLRPKNTFGYAKGTVDECP